MRILSVAPVRVDAEELSRRQDRYNRLCPPGVEFVLRPNGPGAPPQFADERDIAASTASVTDALDALPTDGFTYRMPDCVLDPAVPIDPDGATTPTVGMLRLSAARLVSGRRRFGAVTRNPAIAEALTERVEAYGFGQWFAGVTVLDLEFEAIPDADRWNETVRSALDGFAAQGVTAVINGCSAVDADSEDHPVELIDPAALALRLLAAGARPTAQAGAAR